MGRREKIESFGDRRMMHPPRWRCFSLGLLRGRLIFVRLTEIWNPLFAQGPGTPLEDGGSTAGSTRGRP